MSIQETAKTEAIKSAPLLLRQIQSRDRYQASWALRNMVKALALHSWNNTAEDWKRYYEAQIILKIRQYSRIPKNLEASLK